MLSNSNHATKFSELHTVPHREMTRPLRVMFVNTSLPVGGAETLLLNLVRRMDRELFSPEICCLKEPGPIGETLATELPVFCRFLSRKYDITVWRRLARLFRDRQVDAVVTVGAGDKMFWGRLAAWRASVPVVLCALHSTGWPDVINWPNRKLTAITDGFIAVAQPHAEYLVQQERFPRDKVFVIDNGIDTHRFVANSAARAKSRSELGIPQDAPVCGIVAALRPEKNHELFLRVADDVRQAIPDAHFVIVGDGPLRGTLEQTVSHLNLQGHVHFTGSRSDIDSILPAFDIFSLTSQMEANPVSILEALSCRVPVVAPRVGSVPETVRPGESGILVDAGDRTAYALAWQQLLRDKTLRQQLGESGRSLVEQSWSLDVMVHGYENLIRRIYDGKRSKGTNHRDTSEFDAPARLEAEVART